ncbi:uncharacterized protein CLUP02_16243 [Colletotrichum lupini]|uniref:Uncharacterized protein n=1 Tax=Colletotrichum lupini TaxID=145971 RepID=A0A9Q8WP11_9PEZI|nr:uncharacterized protein CLUP02_16243 [Colletotrichum lupini]UQC90713.1 hypothetical protein CLUP02_16243 [Colletotrichum lupini]
MKAAETRERKRFRTHSLMAKRDTQRVRMGGLDDGRLSAPCGRIRAVADSLVKTHPSPRREREKQPSASWRDFIGFDLL